MVVIDCIMPVKYSTPELVAMTGKCIASLHYSQDFIKFNVIQVEDDGNNFSYNRQICKGLQQSTSKIVMLANNDLLFHRDWITPILEALLQNKAESFSSWNPNYHERYFKTEGDYYLGYRIARELCGWLIVTTRKVLDQIDFCNEENFRTSFYYSDNIYSDLLQKHNIKHALIRNSKVTHLLSKTLKTHPKEKQIELTIGQKKKYLHG